MLFPRDPGLKIRLISHLSADYGHRRFYCKTGGKNLPPSHGLGPRLESDWLSVNKRVGGRSAVCACTCVSVHLCVCGGGQWMVKIKVT